MKRKEIAEVLSQERLSEDIYSLVLKVSFAGEVKAGQFISVFSKDQSHLLPRPISICSMDDESIRIVYRVVGFGTKEFSSLKAGDQVAVMGPMGNGFPIEKMKDKSVLLIGGGIGIPPMMSAAKALRAAAEDQKCREIAFAVGYRSADTYLLDELKALAPVYISTDDGSLGTHGTVLDAIREHHISCDVIFACGPKPMLRAVKDYALEHDIECYVSMEEKMACGVGVCLGCVTKTTAVDAHSKVKNARVCKDGPVFLAQEVDLT